MQKLFSILLLITFFVVVTGCGDGKLKTYPVSGTVTYNGSRLSEQRSVSLPKSRGKEMVDLG